MVTVDYFTDMLCVWAYGGQIRLDELKGHFGDKVQIRYRFMPIFASANKQIEQNWKNKNGHEGFNQHLQQVATQWPHVSCSNELWMTCRPASSIPSHLVLKATQLLDEQNSDAGQELGTRSPFEMMMWKMREAFFLHNQDISRMDVLAELVQQAGYSWQQVNQQIESGEAFASLADDEKLKQQYCLQGSPSYVLNEGRQVLYGNVGYRIIQANIDELLNREQGIDGASWC